MNEPYVSSYDEIFKKSIDTSIDTMPKEFTQTIKDISDKIYEDVIQDLFYYLEDEMKTNLDDTIRSSAAKVAESMLADALAGDDKEIKNLFGFNDCYMKSLYVGEKPTQWALIDKIVERNPELFINEKIKQQNVDIKILEFKVKRLNEYIQYQKDINNLESGY